MSYFSPFYNTGCTITDANIVQAQVLMAYLSDPTVVARQDPWSGITAGVTTYYGYALPSANEDAPVWRIRQYIVVGGVAKNLHPNGDNLFSYRWSQRTGYTYA